MNRRRTTLAAFNDWKKRDFAWGDSDCVSFAAYVAQKITGVDYKADFTYASQTDADEIIDACGGLRGLLCRVLGQPSAELEDGDPVLVKIPMAGELVGVKFGNAAVVLSARAMLQIDTRYIATGWHVCSS